MIDILFSAISFSCSEIFTRSLFLKSVLTNMSARVIARYSGTGYHTFTISIAATGSTDMLMSESLPHIDKTLR